MVWGNCADSLEQFCTTVKAKLWRIEITGNREELAADLRQLGFTETMVFPELPALGLELSKSEGWKK